jgi:tellurite resistance protein TerC
MLAFWIAFNTFVLAVLLLDLGLFHRKARVMRVREALGWSLFWILLAAGFAVLVYFWRGHADALAFTTGYLIEESLSVDNLFVFLLVFEYFRVPPEQRYKVLFWGILGALVMRLAFILAGVAVLQRFQWLLYVFGAIVIYSGFRLLLEEERQVEPEKNPLLRLFRRFFPVSSEYHHGHFFVREQQRRLATPLFLVLLVVETTDLIFAVDSIPAVLAVSRDPFIVYTSNVFAILGLRSLYFALAGMMGIFRFLNTGVAIILVFVGAKMVASHWYELPNWATLAMIVATLAGSIGASLLWPKSAETA